MPPSPSEPDGDCSGRVWESSHRRIFCKRRNTQVISGAYSPVYAESFDSIRRIQRLSNKQCGEENNNNNNNKTETNNNNYNNKIERKEEEEEEEEGQGEEEVVVVEEVEYDDDDALRSPYPQLHSH